MIPRYSLLTEEVASPWLGGEAKEYTVVLVSRDGGLSWSKHSSAKEPGDAKILVKALNMLAETEALHAALGDSGVDS